MGPGGTWNAERSLAGIEGESSGKKMRGTRPKSSWWEGEKHQRSAMRGPEKKEKERTVSSSKTLSSRNASERQPVPDLPLDTGHLGWPCGSPQEN